MEYTNSIENKPDYEKEQKRRDYAKKIIERFESKRSKRSNWESNWQECMDYIMPRKNDVLTYKTPGDKRGNEDFLFDSTAIHANELLASAMHGYLTNPAIRIFDLVPADAKLADLDEVKAYTEECANIMQGVLNKTNFQTEVHEIHLDEACIGTACLYMGDHEDKILHYSARPMKEIFIDENNLGIVDCVDRLFKWTPRQIVQEFGFENCPYEVQKMYSEGKNEELSIIHSVYPTDDTDEVRSKKFKFKSCYVLMEPSVVLSEGGFEEFPYAVPRWTKTSGEIYGRGPGMQMLPEIKMINAMMKATIEGAQKTVNPPMAVVDDGVIGRVRLVPNGLTIVRGDTPNAITPLITNSRIDFGFQMIEESRKRIRSGFYVDQLQMQQGPQKTATEVMQVTDENNRLLAPIVGRQHYEFLKPVAERLYGRCLRKGLLPKAPKVLQGKDLNVQYSAPIARAQRVSEVQNFTRAVAAAAPIFQIDPNATAIIKKEDAVRYIMDIYGVPSKLIQNKAEMEEIRAQQQQAQEQAQMQAQQQAEAETAAKLMPGLAQMGQVAKG